MAVPSSGELRLYADIGVELGVPQSDVSLGAMSDSAGFSEPDSMSDFYGYVDAVAPSVTTNAISNVGETTLRANGNVTSDGGGTITERGFYVGTNSASPTNNAKYTVSGTTGSYLFNVTGLSDNTTFYVWAFATNVAGTTYGSRVQATTVQSFTPILARGSSTSMSGEITGGGYGSFITTHYYQNPYTSSLVQTTTNDRWGTVPISASFGTSTLNAYATNARNFCYFRLNTGGELNTGNISGANIYSDSNYDYNNRSIYLSGRWSGTTGLIVDNNSQSSMRARTSDYQYIWPNSYIIMETDYDAR